MYLRLKYTNRFRDFARETCSRAYGKTTANTGYVTKVESVISNDRGHKVHYLVEVTGRGTPEVHRILKSDLKVAKAFARLIPHLLSEDGCIHNQA